MRAAAAKGEVALVAAYQGLLEGARLAPTGSRGSAGIEDYAGKGRSPRTDLGHANAAALDLIRLPALRAELTAAPAESSQAVRCTPLSGRSRRPVARPRPC